MQLCVHSLLIQITFKSNSTAEYFRFIWSSSGKCSVVESRYTSLVSTFKLSMSLNSSTLKEICLRTKQFILSCASFPLPHPCFLYCIMYFYNLCYQILQILNFGSPFNIRTLCCLFSPMNIWMVSPLLFSFTICKNISWIYVFSTSICLNTIFTC
jgi:hypothetical protein